MSEEEETLALDHEWLEAAQKLIEVNDKLIAQGLDPCDPLRELDLLLSDCVGYTKAEIAGIKRRQKERRVEEARARRLGL